MGGKGDWGGRGSPQDAIAKEQKREHASGCDATDACLQRAQARRKNGWWPDWQIGWGGVRADGGQVGRWDREAQERMVASAW
eukprot:366380-Chlamydomonas_euryale.AAC.16